MNKLLLLLITPVIISNLFSSQALADNHNQSTEQVTSVVEKMNRALTERDVEALVSTFSPDGVAIDLFPAHQYGKMKKGGEFKIKTENLTERWSRVARVLFASTKMFKRTITGINVQVDNGMAVAWIDVKSESLSVKEGAKNKVAHFKEICVLRLYGDEWKIVTLTNNRHNIRS